MYSCGRHTHTHMEAHKQHERAQAHRVHRHRLQSRHCAEYTTAPARIKVGGRALAVTRAKAGVP